VTHEYGDKLDQGDSNNFIGCRTVSDPAKRSAGSTDASAIPQICPRLLHPALGPFFGSTRAASILPSRPPTLAAAARKGLSRPAGAMAVRLPSALPGRALTAPSTAASCIGRDRKASHHNLSHGCGPRQFPTSATPPAKPSATQAARGVRNCPEPRTQSKECSPTLTAGEVYGGRSTIDGSARPTFRKAGLCRTGVCRIDRAAGRDCHQVLA
jgi:hypothetical protein